VVDVRLILDGADEPSGARTPTNLAGADMPHPAALMRSGELTRPATVWPDHGCDPATGRHDADPVPHVTWTSAASAVVA
jgi:hypothetical protein